ncbi:PfkB family carbohydrate kinase [Pseudokineococcus marinus]|uniref:Ribokinase n=1 Tax=Pseudokineococcus marinus TaxID=351215 RepID=A0A849BKE0_9ACTN|nr:PfkB family carbohydrate kinase [Pseudokineococcus marinus]NNH21557.1 ribokinase [Pseudokineococcus marinus]
MSAGATGPAAVTVAVVGSVHQDLHLHVGELPRPGETLMAREWGRAPGGKGANQAVACATAGAGTAMVGAVGDDAAADAVVAALRTAGVEVALVQRLASRATSTAVVTVAADGTNSIVVAADASSALAPRSVEAALAELPAVAVVLSQAEVPEAVVRAAAAGAAAAGARTVHNLAPYRPVGAALLACCDPLVVNEVEAASLAHDLGLDADAPETLAGRLADACASVVVTLGAQGAVWARGAEGGHVPSPEVPVVDTSGAGDAFVGALCASLARGDALPEACSAGVAAGARAVQHRGAQTAAPPAGATLI